MSCSARHEDRSAWTIPISSRGWSCSFYGGPARAATRDRALRDHAARSPRASSASSGRGFPRPRGVPALRARPRRCAAAPLISPSSARISASRSLKSCDILEPPVRPRRSESGSRSRLGRRVAETVALRLMRVKACPRLFDARLARVPQGPSGLARCWQPHEAGPCQEKSG